MLLIIEIWLTVKAWNKGWKALALLPAGLALGVGFMVGAAIGSSGGSVEGLWVLGLLIDLGAITVLGFMCAKAPQCVADTAPTVVPAVEESVQTASFPDAAGIPSPRASAGQV